MGAGSQLILEDHPTALHVHLYAAPGCARQPDSAAPQHGQDGHGSRRIIQLADEQRRNWYQRFFSSADWKNSRHYHLMLDTGRIPEEAAVALIVDAARTAPPI